MYLCKTFLKKFEDIRTMKKSHLLALCLLACICLISCKKEKSPAEIAQQELTVKKENGFCATHEFENDIWAFPKKQLDNGDVTILKNILIKGDLPDNEDHYDLTLIIDFLPTIETEVLPLDITTISPDGNSRQSISLKVDFVDNQLVKEIKLPDGRMGKRYTKVLYPQKKFTEKGTYTFDIYSKYTKLSLPGIHSISVKLQENNSDK